MHSIERIRANREKADFDEQEWLKERGWGHSCDFPGSLWLWTKRIKRGRNQEVVVAVNQGTAVWMQESIQ